MICTRFNNKDLSFLFIYDWAQILVTLVVNLLLYIG